MSVVENKTTCIQLGLQWQTDFYNFDSVPEGLMALFVISTLDGWADITRNGMACVGIDKQPQPNANYWNVLYFASFLLIVVFFALNTFVGVVVNNFQKVQMKLANQTKQEKRKGAFKRLFRKMTQTFDDSLRRSPLQKQEAVENESTKSSVDSYYWLDFGPWRALLFKIVTHDYFEIFMTLATAVNFLILSAEFYQMPDSLRLTSYISGLIFLLLMALEALLKIIAMGPCNYWKETWNKFDFSIFALSLLATVLEHVQGSDFNSPVIRIIRIARISRIVKLWRAANGVRMMLNTVSKAIPH